MPDGTEVYRPRLKATVGIRKKQVIYQATVDSGADNSIISFELVEPLGARWDRLIEPRQEWGAGGPFETRWCRDGTIYHDGTLICSGFRVAQPNPNIEPFFLFGRSDFFKKFIPSFHWEDAPPWFEIDKVP